MRIVLKSICFLCLTWLNCANQGLFSQWATSTPYADKISRNGFRYKVVVASEIPEPDSIPAKRELASVSTYGADGRLLVYQSYFNSRTDQKEINSYDRSGRKSKVLVYDYKGDFFKSHEYEFDSVRKTVKKKELFRSGKTDSTYWKYDSLGRLAEVRFDSHNEIMSYRMFYQYPAANETIFKYYKSGDSLASETHLFEDSTNYVKKIFALENGNRYLYSIAVFDSLGNKLEECLGFGKPIGEDFRSKMSWTKYEYHDFGLVSRVSEYRNGRLNKIQEHFYYKTLPSDLIPPPK